MKKYDVVIIGGGSAGLAAAVTLKEEGIQNIVVLEKDDEAGGILQQCIHNGFGLQTFHEQLSGPAYAERYIRQAKNLGVEIKLGTMVVSATEERIIEYVNKEEGYVKIQADAVIFAVGCYERNRGAVEIPGDRPAGVYTAGQAQRYLNIDGYLVGKKVFILGSGDIGLIMARRMTLEGAKVYGVAELMPYSNGLPRNIKQCLEDFEIPLYLSHTVTHIYGSSRLEKIEVSRVGEDRKPIKGSEMYFDVDTLLLSVGLVPENHLADLLDIKMHPRTNGPIVDENYMTSQEGYFACGNGLHVHDLVDFVSMESTRAAKGVCRYLKNGTSADREISTIAGDNVNYVVPGILHPGAMEDSVEFFFRVARPMEAAVITVSAGDTVLSTQKKKKLMPSEMERVRIPAEKLNLLQENLKIEVKESV